MYNTLAEHVCSDMSVYFDIYVTNTPVLIDTIVQPPVSGRGELFQLLLIPKVKKFKK
jgi:hypothetical protein